MVTRQHPRCARSGPWFEPRSGSTSFAGFAAFGQPAAGAVPRTRSTKSTSAELNSDGLCDGTACEAPETTVWRAFGKVQDGALNRHSACMRSTASVVFGQEAWL
jgi:hypothetical protein